MKTPTVSVIMATYNHARFVRKSIESVLAQRGVDFDFLISDDGSSDKTNEVITSIGDERIHFFKNSINRGACTVTNELIERAVFDLTAVVHAQRLKYSAQRRARADVFDALNLN